MIRTVLGFLAVSTVVLAACAPADDGAQSDTNDVTENAIAGDTVYVVTGRDFRKCSFPMCGGFWVKAVNKLKTTCFDGTKAPECYVAAIDDAALGLEGTQRDEFLAGLEAGQHIAAAELAPLDEANPGMGKLALTKGYEDASANETTGAYFLVRSSGIVCVTAPCPSIATKRLNTGTERNVTEVDFSGLGLSQDDVDAAFGQIFESSLVVSGKIVKQGNNVRLVASDFFTTIEPEPAALCLSDEACGAGASCDFTTCHSNCPPGNVCPAVCWGECVTEPAPQLCLSDAACDAGESCDFTVCHSNCPPGNVCPAVCWGACGAGASAE